MIYTIGWIAWLLWFAIEEGVALYKGGSGATLSAHVWHWFGTDVHGTQARKGSVRARKFALLALMSWLLVHFLSGGWV